MTAIPEIMDAKSLGGFRVWIRFQGGLQGNVDLSGYSTFGPVFEPLAEESFFKKFTIQGGTLAWPNGADIAPERLYELVSTKPI
jgi:Protein of unknown function (DUF2442)